ncbi:MAG: hypothetical protein ACKPBU_10805 [Alphaproteobacteria bacterium]
MRSITLLPALGLLVLLAGCSDSADPQPFAAPADHGRGPWQPVAPDRVAEECGLDPALLESADAKIDRPWAIVRHGRLCHEFYPEGAAGNGPSEVFSATKTLGAVVTGIAAWETRDVPRTGRKTGPLSDEDRVDQWIDSFTFNPDALVAHVLAMVAHNLDLSPGAKSFQYDAIGTVQINRMSDVVNAAIAQDPGRLGADVDELTRRYLFEPLGMTESTWTGGAPDKVFAYSWQSTVRDMARLGLLLLNDGVWSGRRVLGSDWIYKMTHPSFEDANTGYGYLTWLMSNSNWDFGDGLPKGDEPPYPCFPAALWGGYPHAPSAATDCNYVEPWGCGQRYDVGVWYAAGAGGQYIVGHPGLDVVLVAKDLGPGGSSSTLWEAARPALVALDPTFRGDDAAFCGAYAANEYAPALGR